jgi:hypothetical protein
MFYPGKDHAAGSCEEAINFTNKFLHHNASYKSLRFSSKVKFLLAEEPKLNFMF